MITELLIATSAACSAAVGFLLARKDPVRGKTKNANRNANRIQVHLPEPTQSDMAKFAHLLDMQHTIDELTGLLTSKELTNQEYLGIIQQLREENRQLRRARELPLLEIAG